MRRGLNWPLYSDLLQRQDYAVIQAIEVLDDDAISQLVKLPSITVVPELTEEQLRAMADEEWTRRPRAAEDREAWVQTFVEVGLMLSGKAIPH
jgi:PHP family Zn ribbon phosphoesterase